MISIELNIGGVLKDDWSVDEKVVRSGFAADGFYRFVFWNFSKNDEYI